MCIRKILNFVDDRDDDVRTAFMLIPISFMEDDKYAGHYMDMGCAVPEPSGDYPLVHRLRTDLAGLGVDVIDLHEILDEGDGRSVSYSNDWHLNELENELAAGAIIAWLLE